MSKPSNSDNTHIEKVNTKDLSSLIDKKIDEINFDRAEEYVQRLQKKYVYQSNHENAQIIIIGRILQAGGLYLENESNDLFSILKAAFKTPFDLYIFLKKNVIQNINDSPFENIADISIKMVYQIAYLYDFSLQQEDIKNELIIAFGAAFFGKPAIEDGINWLQSDKFTTISIIIPTKALVIYSVGQIACAIYQEKFKQNNDYLKSSTLVSTINKLHDQYLHNNNSDAAIDHLIKSEITLARRKILLNIAGGIENNSDFENINTQNLSDWIVNSLCDINFHKSNKYVQLLQKKYSDKSNHEKAQIIIISKTLEAGGLELGNQLLDLFSGLKGIIQNISGCRFEEITDISVKMVYEIAYLYGFDVQDQDIKTDLIIAFGAAFVGEQVIDYGVAWLSFSKFATIAISVSAKALMIYSIGQIACAIYEEKSKQNNNYLESSTFVSEIKQVNQKYLHNSNTDAVIDNFIKSEITPDIQDVLEEMAQESENDSDGDFQRYVIPKLLNSSPGVLAFTKLDRKDELFIIWQNEKGIKYKYQPDFVVNTGDRMFLLETKGDHFIAEPSAILKVQAAVESCKKDSAFQPPKVVKKRYKINFEPSLTMTYSEQSYLRAKLDSYVFLSYSQANDKVIKLKTSPVFTNKISNVTLDSESYEEDSQPQQWEYIILRESVFELNEEASFNDLLASMREETEAIIADLSV